MGPTAKPDSGFRPLVGRTVFSRLWDIDVATRPSGVASYGYGFHRLEPAWVARRVKNGHACVPHDLGLNLEAVEMLGNRAPAQTGLAVDSAAGTDSPSRLPAVPCWVGLTLGLRFLQVQQASLSMVLSAAEQSQSATSCHDGAMARDVRDASIKHIAGCQPLSLFRPPRFQRTATNPMCKRFDARNLTQISHRCKRSASKTRMLTKGNIYSEGVRQVATKRSFNARQHVGGSPTDGCDTLPAEESEVGVGPQPGMGREM